MFVIVSTMRRHTILLLLFLVGCTVFAQKPTIHTKPDTLKTNEKRQSPFNTGFYPIAFFDIDLKYIIKYNNYEGLRLGFGGITNDKLSEKFKIGGYFAYGFKDDENKYSIGASALLSKPTSTWLSAYYINDLAEIGSFKYLTDDRVYSVFEPRLLNVKQFYKHQSWQATLQHEFSKKILSEIVLLRSSIVQIENYQFVKNDQIYEDYELAEASVALRISPKTNFFTREDGFIEYYDGLPKISAQVTKGIGGVLGSEFEYTKYGLKLDYYIKRTNLSSTNILVEGNYAAGNAPLTHLFHSSPNAPTNDEILQRFSVTGRRSFETMYFGEFFSDKLITLQLRHSLRRFYFSKRFQPELVILSKHALGDLGDRETHQGIGFNTLDQLYSEAGLELNKLFFGFGLSGAYRYGFYNLTDFEDNVSFKFTFYAKF
jgi:hypothetical protein